MAMVGKSEHEYLGWKIRITDKAVESQFSAMVEVWEPGQHPITTTSAVVPFVKRAATTEEARAFALNVAHKWIDRAVAMKFSPPPA